MKVNFTLNHHPESWDVDPNEYFLDTLRAHDITSVRRGCDTTSCGVCTVLMDGKPVPSCSVLSISLEGKTILTALCGHGHLDLASYDRYMRGEMQDLELSDDLIKAAMLDVPEIA